MSSLPLHPAIVHLPLGLAFIIPLLALGFAWAMWTGRVRPRAWAAVVALQAMLLGGGLIAMNTGEREEERVEAVVPDAALEQHEAAAEQFVWATAATLLLAALVLVAPGGAARLLTATTVLATMVVAAAAIRVGHAGGRLVYQHNAGAAYAAPAQAQIAGEAPTPLQSRRRAGDDDDDRDRR
jgi:uncharacterized membrane protein